MRNEDGLLMDLR